MIIKLYNTQKDKPLPKNQFFGSPECEIVTGLDNIRYEIIETPIPINSDISYGNNRTVEITAIHVETAIRTTFKADVRAIICTDEGKTVEVINL